MPSERTRKPRPHQKKATVFKPTGPHASSSQTPRTTQQKPNKAQRQRLTLYDWLLVLDFVDKHPAWDQQAVVDHFKHRKEGVLLFTQSALSRKLKPDARAELEARAKSNPTALSSKRARVVTRPDVEKALWLWQQDMENRSEVVTGPMLVEKRKRFEELFGVPEEERLKGTGWLTSFKQTYQIKQNRRHGEAASADMAAVQQERIRIRRRTARYAPKDIFNGDETAFISCVPPDAGLSSKKLSGKKKDKSRITAFFVCNADGSEKREIFFIGRAKQPRCFGKKKPQAHGFYYRANKKAWMTQVLFDEWLRKFDLDMGRQKRKVCLLVDNASGHAISYVPRNVELIFFEPNLTAHVQPCDAGIIRCIKAIYRRVLCIRAIDLDEAGEIELFKISLLEAMNLLKNAWQQVTQTTIRNCWVHSGVTVGEDEEWEDVFVDADAPSDDEEDSDVQMDDTAAVPIIHPLKIQERAWGFLLEFAQSDVITLPEAEDQLKALLGDSYKPQDWQAVLDAIMRCENDHAAALEAVRSFHPAQPSTVLNSSRFSPTAQLKHAEETLFETLTNLKTRGCLRGPLPTLDQAIDPYIEQEDADSEETHFSDGKSGEEEIVAYVQRQEAIERGEVIEVDTDGEDDDDGTGAEVPLSDIVSLCEKLEKACLQRASLAIDLPTFVRGLRAVRASARHEQLEYAQQTSIESYFTPQ